MYISEPYRGLIYTAKRSVRWGKYLWHAVNCATLAEQRVPAAQVPRRIRKCAYGLFWRDTNKRIENAYYDR